MLNHLSNMNTWQFGQMKLCSLVQTLKLWHLFLWVNNLLMLLLFTTLTQNVVELYDSRNSNRRDFYATIAARANPRTLSCLRLFRRMTSFNDEQLLNEYVSKRLLLPVLAKFSFVSKAVLAKILTLTWKDSPPMNAIDVTLFMKQYERLIFEL